MYKNYVATASALAALLFCATAPEASEEGTPSVMNSLYNGTLEMDLAVEQMEKGDLEGASAASAEAFDLLLKPAARVSDAVDASGEGIPGASAGKAKLSRALRLRNATAVPEPETGEKAVLAGKNGLSAEQWGEAVGGGLGWGLTMALAITSPAALGVLILFGAGMALEEAAASTGGMGWRDAARAVARGAAVGLTWMAVAGGKVGGAVGRWLGSRIGGRK